jgi:hypothetical protein
MKFAIWILFELDSPSVHHFVRALAFEISLTFPLQFLHPDSSEKALAVIRGTQMIYFHLSVVGGGMNKLIVTDVDPHMRAIPTPSKKDQIPFFQLVLFNLFPYRELFSGSPGKLNIKNFIDLFYKG